MIMTAIIAPSTVESRNYAPPLAHKPPVLLAQVPAQVVLSHVQAPPP